MAYRFVTDGDYVNFYDGDSPVVRLHNTSRCISWRFDDTSGIIFNIDNFEFQTHAMSNILFDDVECTTQASFQTNIESMFPDMAGGGGGGSSVIQTATVTLTDAQIKALPTTPVEIVAAPGEGKMIIPVAGIYNAVLTAGYSDLTDASFQLILGTSAISSPFSLVSILLGGSGDRIVFIGTTELATSVSFGNSVIGGSIVSTSTVSNEPLSIGDVYNGVNNYTGGNAANTLKVTVYYTIVDL